MIINKNNWFAMYYNWIYGNYPKDVCSFFWGSVIILLLFPFVVIGRLLMSGSSGDEKYLVFVQTMIGIVMYLLGFLVIALGNSILEAFGYKFLYTWSIILGGIGLGILTIVIIGAGIFLIILLCKGITEVPNTHVFEDVGDWIGAIRGKYCTKITWKE